MGKMSLNKIIRVILIFLSLQNHFFKNVGIMGESYNIHKNSSDIIYKFLYLVNKKF